MTDSNWQPRIVAFFCNWCTYTAADLAGVSRMKYAANVRVIRLMCSGRVDPQFIVDALALGGGDPFKAHALRLDAHVGEHPFQKLKAAQHLVVALDVVAIPGVAAADDDAVGSPGQGIEDELGIDPAGAHEPDHADVGGVLQPRHAGEVRGRIGAPVAEERNDARLPRGGCGYRG